MSVIWGTAQAQCRFRTLIYNMESHGDFQSLSSGGIEIPPQPLCGYLPVLPFPFWCSTIQSALHFSPSPTHCNWSSSSIDCLKAVWHSIKLQSYPLASAKLINIILGKLSTQLPLVSVLPQDWHTSLHLHQVNLQQWRSGTTPFC